MKSLLSLLIACIILGGMVFAGFSIYKNYISDPDGEIAEESRKIDSFSQLELDGVLNFYVSQGKEEKIEIEADENIIDDIEIKNKNGVLKIKLDRNYTFPKRTKSNVYITVVDINRIEIKGIGNVSIDHLEVEDLELEVSGVGNKTFDIYCKKLDAEIESVGNITFTGRARDVKIKNSSVGNLTANEFETKNLKLENLGAGNVKVHADREIHIISSGIGNVKYSGEAEVKELEINGIGRVKKTS